MSENKTKSVTEEELTKIKKNLEVEGSRKTTDILLSGNVTEKKIKGVLTDGIKKFEEETGRKMTYGEMREMYG